jgi:RHS repeat-associated protein
VVSVGLDQTIAIPGSTTLPGVVTDDGLPIGGMLTSMWSKVSGPGPVAFADATRPNTTAAFLTAGTYVLRLTASDGALTSSADLVVSGRAASADTAPTIYSQAPTVATEGVLYSYAVMAEDLDGDVLSFALPTAPAGMTIDSARGLILWTPPPGSAGTAAVTVRVSDPAGKSAQQSYSITVIHGSSAPRITSSPPLSGTAGATYVYAATAIDPDSSTLTWSVTGPTGMTVNAAGRVSWPVPAGVSGGFPVTLSVADPDGHTTTQSWSIGVAVPGDTTAPTVAITAPGDGLPLTNAVDVIGTATDADLTGYQLQLCRSWGMPGCTLLKQGTAPVSAGTLGHLDPRAIADGTWQLVLTATDAAGNSGSTSVSVVVNTGVRKLTAIRLDFAEFQIRTNALELIVHRIYDGLDVGPGALGNGWKYDWDVGHQERPKLLENGWSAVLGGGFIPQFQIDPNYDHPLNFILSDGRVYTFTVALNTDTTIASILPVYPTFIETDTLGPATLKALRSDFSAYSTTDFSDNLSAGVGQDLIFENFDPSQPWEPVYYELDTQFNERYIFNANGQVQQFDDGSGFVFSTSPTGFSLNGVDILHFDFGADGKIAAATDTLDGARVQYQRDTNGDLTQVTLADGTLQTFVYAPGSHMTAYTTGSGDPDVYDYDDQGRVVRHVAPGGIITSTAYDDVNNRVTSTDAAGNSVTTQFDNDGNATRVTDPLGNVTIYTYKPGTNLQLTKKDPLGNIWQFDYDSKGNPNKFTDPLNHVRTQVTDPTGRVTVATDAEGRVFAEQTDASNKVTAHVLPDGTVTKRFSYPDDSTVVETDPQGRNTTTHYDAKGRALSTTDPNGTETINYDDTHNSFSVTDRAGQVSGANLDRLGRTVGIQGPGTGTIQYTYDDPERVPSKVVSPDGSVTQIVKDGAGRISRVTRNGAVIEQNRYDALGRLASTQKNGESTSYRYDADGRVTMVTSSSGTKSYTYDAGGHITQVADSSGATRGLAFDAAGRPVTFTNSQGQFQFGYDKSDRVTTAVDASGRTYGFGYDANGLRNSTTLPGGLSISWTNRPADDLDNPHPIAGLTDVEGVTWSYNYDLRDVLVAVTDALGGVTTYGRDAEERLSTITDALTRTQQFTYDGAGIQSVTSAAGRTQRYAHNGSGQVQSWTRADNTVVNYQYASDSVTTVLPDGSTLQTVEDAQLGTTTYAGGAGGDVVRWRTSTGQTSLFEVSDGSSCAVTYTAAGTLATITATTPGGATFNTSYGYDADGRISQVTDPDGGATHYSYDSQGRLTRVDRPNNTHSEYTYGGLDRPTQIQHFAGAALISTYSYTYDANGRVTAQSTPEGNFQYQYDALSRLAVEEKLDGGGVVVETTTRVWDGVGNLAALTDASGTTMYSYDLDDRLTSSSGPAGVTSYSYNDRGSLLSIQSPAGTSTFTYDALDHLSSVTGPGGTVSYLYDATGRLLARTDATGTRRCLPLPVRPDRALEDCAVTYSTDLAAEQPQANVFDATGLASVHGAAMLYTFTGEQNHVVALFDGSGNAAGSSGYDAWGVRTAHTGTEIGYGYTGERQDPVTGLVYLRARWYHPQLGRFLTVDHYAAASTDPRTLHRYVYASDNPLNHLDPSGQQDFTIQGQMEAVSIDSVLNSISDVLYACVQKKLKGKILRSIVKWAINAAFSPVKQALEDALKKVVVGAAASVVVPPEIQFLRAIAQIMCSPPTPNGVSDIEFEPILNDCGDDYANSNYPLLNCGAIVRSISDLYNRQGLDIIVNKSLPIELKRENSTASGYSGQHQLVRYCRFAAAKGYHLMLYVYYQLPQEPTNLKKAIDCFGCWNVDAAACNGRQGLGSIYVAFGLYNNKPTVYFPSASALSCD